MPWYYAGPEAKPVGPISLDELHARRASGAIAPETYVIEHTGQPDGTIAWKRYQEIFPSSPIVPPAPPIPAAPPAPVWPSLPAAMPHPLFPSASPATHPVFPSTLPAPHPVFPSGARPDPYYHIKPTNSWCAWGFGLSLAGFFLSFMCGTGIFLALPALILCFVGLMQVHKRNDQSGQGLAIAGLVLSFIALFIGVLFIISMALPMITAHEQTVTEQTTNDSD